MLQIDFAEVFSRRCLLPFLVLPVLPFKYKYLIIARYSTLFEKHAFASLAMFDINILLKNDSINVQLCTHV